MKTLILQDSSESTLNLLVELAKKLGVKASFLSDSEQIDFKLGLLMDQEKTGEYVEEDTVLYKLNKK